MQSYFFFNDTATTEIYTTYDTLSLHDALPISGGREPLGRHARPRRAVAAGVRRSGRARDLRGPRPLRPAPRPGRGGVDARHRREPERHLPRDPRGAPADDGPGARADHHDRVDPRQD